MSKKDPLLTQLAQGFAAQRRLFSAYTLLGATLDLALGAISAIILSQVLLGLSADPSKSLMSSSLMLAFALAVILIIIKLSLQIGFAKQRILLGQNISHALYSQGLKRALLPAQDPVKISSTGKIAALLLHENKKITPYFTRYEPSKLQLTILPPFILILIASTSWVMALTLLGFAVIMIAVQAVIGYKLKQSIDKEQQAYLRLAQLFLDRVITARTFRALGFYEKTRQDIYQDAQSLSQRTMAILKRAFIGSAAQDFLIALSFILFAPYLGAAFFALQADKALPFGMTEPFVTNQPWLLIASFFWMASYFTPFRLFSAAYHDQATAKSAAQSLAEFIEEEPKQALSVQHKSPLPQNFSSLKIKGLEFSYDKKAAPLLPALDLDLSSPSLTVITGQSGRGKSSLLACFSDQIAYRFSQASLNGKAIDHLNISPITAWAGLQPYIVQGSLFGVIAWPYALMRFSDDQQALIACVEQAAKQAGLWDDPLLSQGLESSVLDGGANLSGGQRQRIALARLFCAQASLWLCDEPTAQLDEANAALLRRSLFEAAKSRALLISSHDPQLIMLADKVIDLDAHYAKGYHHEN